MSEGEEKSPPLAPPVSTFAGPVAELIAQRMLQPPARPGLLAALDHFEILRLLGGGGMGVVLLARDANTGRDAAIKLVKSELVGNQQVVHRFLKEAGHLKRLRHTNIVPVEEISDRAEGPYFVMPYFEKGSLASRIIPEKALDTESILDIATQVAEGLGFAHRSGIIHRDLKPANILLGANGQVCLGDFGLARTMFNDSIVDVESRHLEGTAPYMSPAVAAGNAEDTRCDIYSFGALLYEMLTGRPPYQGRGSKEILDQIFAGPPKPILSVNPAADRGLVTVAERAMARELRDRYAEMRDIIGDLQRIKAGKAPAGRHRSQGAWSVPLAVVVAAGLAGAVWWAWMSAHKQAQPVQSQPQPPPAQAVAPAVAPVVSQPAWKTSTLAGQVGAAGSADGPGAQARFQLPNNVAVDHAGTVYVADTANNVIRKIAPDGTASTLAGTAGIHGSEDGAGGAGGQARFWAPFGIAVDAAGTVYVADTANNTIRKITPDGIVSTLAGAAGRPGKADGLGVNARFRNPWDVAVDRAGNVWVADMSNSAIRKITPDGEVSTFAGQPGMIGSADGFGINARFNDPFALAVDGANNIYVADSGNNTIRKISPEGTVVTLAGKAERAGNRDGDVETARFWNPQGLAVDRAGNVYVADTGNNAVRQITPAGVVSTLVQPGGATTLNSPGGVAVDDAGNIYVADTNNHCVRKLALSR
jgi:sugar lactone lactonase YvrE